MVPRFCLNLFKQSIGYLCISLILTNIYIPVAYADSGFRTIDALVDLPEHMDRQFKAIKHRLPEVKEDLKYKDPRLQISIQDLHTAPLHKSSCIEGTLWTAGVLFGGLSSYVAGAVLTSDGGSRTFLSLLTSLPKNQAALAGTTIGIAASEVFKFKESTEDLFTRTLPITPLAQKNNWWFVREATKLIGKIGVFGLSLKAAFAGYKAFNNSIPFGARLLFAATFGLSKLLGMSEDFASTHRNLWAAVSPGPKDVEETRTTWEGKLVGIGRETLKNPAFAEKLYDALQDLNTNSSKRADPTGETQRVANYSSFLLLDSLFKDEDAPKFSPPPASKWAKLGRFFWPEEAPMWWRLTRLAGMTAGLMASGSIWYGSYLAWASTIGLLLPLEGLTATWATVATVYASPAASKAASNVASRTFTRMKEGVRSLWNWGKRKLGYDTEPEGVRHDNPLLWSRDFNMTDVSNPIARGIVDPGSVVLSYFLGLPVSLLGGEAMHQAEISLERQFVTLGPSTFALGEMDNPSVASYTDRIVTYLNSKLPNRFRDEIGRKQTWILRYLKELSGKVLTNSDGFIRGLKAAVDADRLKRARSSDTEMTDLGSDGDMDGSAAGVSGADSAAIQSGVQIGDGTRGAGLDAAVPEVTFSIPPLNAGTPVTASDRQLPPSARTGSDSEPMLREEIGDIEAAGTAALSDSRRAQRLPFARPSRAAQLAPHLRPERRQMGDESASVAEQFLQRSRSAASQSGRDNPLTQPFLQPQQPPAQKPGFLRGLLNKLTGSSSTTQTPPAQPQPFPQDDDSF